MPTTFKKVGDNLMKDLQGRYRTSSLFFEYEKKGYPAFWTTQDEDRLEKGVWYASLKKIYLSYNHIPDYEYQFAEDIFGSWDHWYRLSTDGGKLLTSMVSVWREEMEIKLRANALMSVIREASSSGASAVAAAKYIAERGYDKRAGRPTKAAIKKETRIMAEIERTIDDDAQRIGLDIEKTNQIH